MQQRTPVFLNPSPAFYSSSEGLKSSPSYLSAETPSAKTEQEQEEIFQLIKRQCAKDPILFKKIVEWGARNIPSSDLSEDDIKGIPEDVMKSLADGRLWITARAAEEKDEDLIADSLDNIKGGYQRASSGVWKQPAREACGSGVQHKLFKDENGRWTIESCTKSKKCAIRAQQQKDERWIDLQNNKMEICVHVVPMSKILEKSGEELIKSKTDVMKSMAFLFTSCNHAKLSKLEGRNLKHHITNLEVKLENRYALSFGVQIAHTAKIITQE